MAWTLSADGATVTVDNLTDQTFADWHDADMAGTFTLLSAAAPGAAVALTYAVRPADSHALALDFTVAAKTAEADYLYIAGTDAWGDSQTESIDVAAGNGTYTSTKRWASITAIDCSDTAVGGGTVWADGTLTVVQPRWGTIWEIVANAVYRIDECVSYFNVGAGANVASFLSTDEMVYFPDSCDVRPAINGTITMGQSIAGYRGAKGSHWSCSWAGNGTYFTIPGTWRAYASSLHVRSNVFTYFSGGTTMHDCDLSYNWQAADGNSGGKKYFAFDGTLNSLNRLTIHNAYYGIVCLAIFPAFDIYVSESYYGLYAYNNVAPTVKNISFFAIANKMIRVDSAATILTVVDCGTAISASDVQIDNNGAVLNLSFTVNVHMADPSGGNLAGVSVTAFKEDGTQASTDTTDAGGDIDEMTICYRQYTTTAETETTYSPHRVTMWKAGYEPLIIDNVTVNRPLDWDFELQQPSSGPFPPPFVG